MIYYNFTIMRRNLLLSVCFLMASVLFAGPVTKQQAQEMAKSFIQNRLAAGGGHRASANPQIDLSGEVSGLMYLTWTRIMGMS